MHFMHQLFHTLWCMTGPHPVSQIKNKGDILPVGQNLGHLFGDAVPQKDPGVHVALQDFAVLLSQSFHSESVLRVINAYDIRIFVLEDDFLGILPLGKDDQRGVRVFGLQLLGDLLNEMVGKLLIIGGVELTSERIENLQSLSATLDLGFKIGDKDICNSL